jgi:hypothetical protein
MCRRVIAAGSFDERVPGRAHVTLNVKAVGACQSADLALGVWKLDATRVVCARAE